MRQNTDDLRRTAVVKELMAISYINRTGMPLFEQQKLEYKRNRLLAELGQLNYNESVIRYLKER